MIQTASQKRLDVDILFVIYEQEVNLSSVSEVCKTLRNIARRKVAASTEMQMIYSVSMEALKRHAPVNAQLYDIDFQQKVNGLRISLEQGKQQEFLINIERLLEPLRVTRNKHHMPSMILYYTLAIMLQQYIAGWNLEDHISESVNLYILFKPEDFSCWNAAADYLISISREIFTATKLDQTKRDRQIVEKIKGYVIRNIGGEMTLTHLAEQVHYNPSYISHLFKRVAGENLFDYIKRMKLESAKRLLETTEESVQEISQKLGYDYPQYFSTTFKKATGFTPQEYRFSRKTVKRQYSIQNKKIYR